MSARSTASIAPRFMVNDTVTLPVALCFAATLPTPVTA